MNIRSDIAKRVLDELGETIISDKSVGGGCIADARTIKTNKGNTYFLKSHSGAPGMFLKEANGLSELAKANTIRIPKVILAYDDFLLMEQITSSGKVSCFFEKFGKQLAEMHKYTGEEYGFFEDNYIGASLQFNVPENKEKSIWAEFYFQKRILPQFRFTEQNGYNTKELVQGVSKLETKIHRILSDSEEKPTLLHGDLWGGNYMIDEKGLPVLIDPAVYYGHREADLAMTKMFGGFSSDFYKAYQTTYPLPDGWEYREGVYLLYHYLNHLNLFGMGYYGACIRLLNKYSS